MWEPRRQRVWAFFWLHLSHVSNRKQLLPGGRDSRSREQRKSAFGALLPFVQIAAMVGSPPVFQIQADLAMVTTVRW
jgi:hypothetical protein